jgi:uncharacterized protein involved in exopolysaccharide biosynthesis
MQPKLTIVRNSPTQQASQGERLTLVPPTLAQRLEQARERVKAALHAAEDGDLHPTAFDDIARPLILALRDLEALAISVAVMSRGKASHVEQSSATSLH